jgi:hypothetical protein
MAEESWADRQYMLTNSGVVLAEVSSVNEAMELQAYLAGQSQSQKHSGYTVERCD